MRQTMVLLLLLLVLPQNVWSQEVNKKFALSTQVFLNGQKKKAEQQENGPRRAPRHDLNREMQKRRPLIASPDTVGGIAYIPCFIHLKDVADLGEVRALGVKVEESFDGLDFVTARVPVHQLEALADIENVTRIKVAELMRPTTDVARQLTGTYDLLTQSAVAVNLGIGTKYDGTGVILGIIDTGIDFQHIAFKDKDGDSRIKRAYVYDGSSAQFYTTMTDSEPTTDNPCGDHGTHTSSTAGGSSVIVNGSTVTVTDDHANATYGGMAPGTDLYLAGISDLDEAYLVNALKKMAEYADSVQKPLVVSNSWGSPFVPRDGTGEWADLVGQYFGSSHPGRVILFSSGNNAGRAEEDGNVGGLHVTKSDAKKSSPLGTIIRFCGQEGDYYTDLLAIAYSTSSLNCKLYVLEESTGEIKRSWTVNGYRNSFEGLSRFYSGELEIYIDEIEDGCQLLVLSPEPLESVEDGAYTLALEVFPASGSAKVDMWGGGDTYFTGHLTTNNKTWTAGTDDMSASCEATIPDAISVGAYVSRDVVTNFEGIDTPWYSGNLGDIAIFSSYATPEYTATGEPLPWITGPGAQVIAAINHYHTAEIDEYSYFNKYKTDLIVNSTSNPYGSMQGTSMSTPVVAGIVALWMQAAYEAGIDLTVNDVKEIMKQTAIKDAFTTTGPKATHFGNGKIDALAGIHYILNNIADGLTLIPEDDRLVNGNWSKSQYFDLSGRRVSSQPQKGIYINQGKKVVIN